VCQVYCKFSNNPETMQRRDRSPKFSDRHFKNHLSTYIPQLIAPEVEFKIARSAILLRQGWFLAGFLLPKYDQLLAIGLEELVHTRNPHIAEIVFPKSLACQPFLAD